MTSIVYFVKGSGGIKIGYSTNLAVRLSALRTSSPTPLQLLATIPGSIHTERAVHAKLAGYRLSGEWFRDCPEVRQVIDRLLAGDRSFIVIRARSKKNHSDLAAWASNSIRKLAEPWHRGDRLKDAHKRIADMLGFKGSRVFELWYARAHRILDWEIEAIQTALYSRTEVGRLTLRLNTLTSRLGSARAYRARAALWLAHLCRSSALTIAPWIAEERE